MAAMSEAAETAFKRLFSRRSRLAPVIAALAEPHGVDLRAVDVGGRVLWRSEASGGHGERREVLVDGGVVGFLEGGHADRFLPLVTLLAEAESSKRTLSTEALDLYRQVNMLHRLSSVVGLALTQDDVAQALVGELTPALPAGTDLLVTDPSGGVLAGSSEGAVERFARDPGGRVSDLVVASVTEQANGRILAPLLGGEVPLGYVEARNAGHDFLSPVVGLVTTAAAIAGAAMAQAGARESAQRDAERREAELSRTVSELRDELQLATTRVLGGLLFTDLVDSTATQARVGDAGWANLMRRHNQETDAIVVRNGGRLVVFTGDGIFAVFDSVSRCLRAAVEIRDFVGSLGLQVRIGAHAGEIEQRGSEVFGLAVNVGARVMALAEAGQVLATAIIIELGTAEFGFTLRGTETLKGVPGEWQIFEMSTAP